LVRHLHSSRFFNLHKNGSAFYFQLCLGKPRQCVGVVHFTESSRATFAALVGARLVDSSSNRPLRLEVIERFVDEVEQVLKQNGAREIECWTRLLNSTHPIRGSLPTSSVGAVTCSARLIWRIYCASMKLRFGEAQASRRQRIHRCQRQGITGGPGRPNRHQEVYDVIVENRNARHFPVTMTSEAIQEMVDAFPDRLLFFGAFDGSAMIASGICVKVNSSVLYVFYWGDRPDTNTSVSHSVAQFIYEYAQRARFNVIDLAPPPMAASRFMA